MILSFYPLRVAVGRHVLANLLSTVRSFTCVTGGDSIAAAIARSAALRRLPSRTRVLLLRAFSVPTHILDLTNVRPVPENRAHSMAQRISVIQISLQFLNT